MSRASTPARAIVCAGAEETEYLRAGSGPVVLLLTADYDRPAALRLMALWSADCLVIAPKPPRSPHPASFDSWLRDLTDGLGITPASIVADTQFISAARRFAERDDPRIEHVIRATVVERAGCSRE